MGAGGHTEETGANGDNVIKFPRDWFGSKEDLVPIGPAADRLEAETAAAVTPESDSVPEASDFWGGGVVQPADVPGSQDFPHLVPARDGAAEDACADGFSSEREPSRAHGAWGRHFPLGRVPRAGVLIVAAALVLTVALVVISHLDGRAKSPPREAAVSHSSSVASRRTPTVHVNVAMAPDPLGHLAGTMAVPLSVDVQKLATTARKHAAARSRTKIVAHRTVRRAASVVPPATIVSDEPSTVTPAATGDASAPSGSSSDSAAPTNPARTSSSAPTHASGSSSGGSSTASGPTGLGGVVGKTCNPDCSAG